MRRLGTCLISFLILVGCHGVFHEREGKEVVLEYVRHLNLAFLLPKSYRVVKQHDKDAVLRYMIPEDTRDLSARWLVYKGYFPKRFPEQAEEVSGSIGVLPVVWKKWTEEKDDVLVHHWGALISEKDIVLAEDRGRERPDVRFQFWIWGTNPDKVAQLRERCEKISFEYRS